MRKSGLISTRELYIFKMICDANLFWLNRKSMNCAMKDLRFNKKKCSFVKRVGVDRVPWKIHHVAIYSFPNGICGNVHNKVRFFWRDYCVQGHICDGCIVPVQDLFHVIKLQRGSSPSSGRVKMFSLHQRYITRNSKLPYIHFGLQNILLQYFKWEAVLL
jgi:hypothetical protein